MIFYVDMKETVDIPKLGEQYIAWFSGSSQNNPGGRPHVDVINGQEVELRAFDEGKLKQFIRNVYPRAPYLKVVPIFEDTGSDE